ncbi:hypothetical protein JS44_09505 [Anoxybacillus flavithermus]|uniref:Uncharacterized protein n=1 Tax=Anoxybacillus flavithermus TaxID=33934 RepID=A0A094J2X2_9BACL|nr:hypothetical protein JS44_09505 [Anoxybacillus flavithermus]
MYFVDGTTQTYTADFPIGTQDWNRAAISIHPFKPIDKVDVSAMFRGNYTGTVCFDAIRLMEGNVVTKTSMMPMATMGRKKQMKPGMSRKEL